MHRTHTISLDTEHPFERAVFSALFSVVALCVLSYGYFVAFSVFHVIARKEAIAETVRLSAAVAELDREFFTLSQKVTPEKGASLGLTGTPEAAFVHRPGAVGQASARNEI